MPFTRYSSPTVKPVRLPSRGLGPQTAADLLVKELPPVEYVVPGYIPEGLTVLAGRPKHGKSWLALGLAVAVATGGVALGSIPVKKGRVLYLALEDNERRLQQRLQQIIPENANLENLHVDTECPRLDEGGRIALHQWLDSAKDTRLVIIDVFNKIRAEGRSSDTPYEADYRALAALKRLADERRIAIMIVHHTRKMAAEDPFDTVSGTTGFTGAADTILILAKSGQGATLYGRGRDIHEVETALAFDQQTGAWTVIGPASEARRSDERQAILSILSGTDQPMSPAEIAEELGVPGTNVRQLLRKMVQAGEVAVLGKGKYASPGAAEITANSDNSNHAVTLHEEST
jgi:RecA-family ATPase